MNKVGSLDGRMGVKVVEALTRFITQQIAWQSQRHFPPD